MPTTRSQARAAPTLVADHSVGLSAIATLSTTTYPEHNEPTLPEIPESRRDLTMYVRQEIPSTSDDPRDHIDYESEPDLMVETQTCSMLSDECGSASIAEPDPDAVGLPPTSFQTTPQRTAVQDDTSISLHHYPEGFDDAHSPDILHFIPLNVTALARVELGIRERNVDQTVKHSKDFRIYNISRRLRGAQGEDIGIGITVDIIQDPDITSSKGDDIAYLKGTGCGKVRRARFPMRIEGSRWHVFRDDLRVSTNGRPGIELTLMILLVHKYVASHPLFDSVVLEYTSQNVNHDKLAELVVWVVICAGRDLEPVKRWCDDLARETRMVDLPRS